MCVWSKWGDYCALLVLTSELAIHMHHNIWVIGVLGISRVSSLKSMLNNAILQSRCEFGFADLVHMHIQIQLEI